MANSNSSAPRTLRILVTPLNEHSHINACHGLCEELRDRGHELTFLIDPDFKGKLERYGFKERYLPALENPDADSGQEFWQSFVARNAARYTQPPLVQMADLLPKVFALMFDIQKRMEEPFQQAIDELKPDLIIHDGYICCPTVVNQSIPWVWLFSASPQGLLMDPRLPPFFSGLPATDSSEWAQFEDDTSRALGPLQKQISDHNVSNGGQALEPPRIHPFSQHLTLYMSPEELRYDELYTPPNVVAVDCFVRTMADQKFDLPEQLQNKLGKLIFFSMGSFGCANLDLMTRLLSLLAKSPNRFIVSKGPHQYELPGENLWGERYLPQTAILPLVDLVITHGGNNTVTETFYYGKPMLVMPMFLDQHDNAQRIVEAGLGLKLTPRTCTEGELLGAIESMLANDQLATKMAQIGQRIRSSVHKDRQKVADLIEKLGDQLAS